MSAERPARCSRCDRPALIGIGATAEWLCLTCFQMTLATLKRVIDLWAELNAAP